jgi:hypothetical protein
VDIGGERDASRLLAKTVSEGRNLGVYFYVVSAGRDCPDFSGVLGVMERESEPAFLLLSHPAHLTAENCGRIRAAENTLALVDLDSGGDALQREAAARLKEKRALSGGFFWYRGSGDLAAKLSDREQMKRARDMGLSMLFYKNERPGFLKPGTSPIESARNSPKLPILFSDLYSDIAAGDIPISGSARIVCVTREGSVLSLRENGEERKSPRKIGEAPLADILKTL